MSSLLEQLTNQLGSDQVNAIARQLGASPEQTQSAIAAALPTLLGAMGRRAQTEEGASEIHHAVTQASESSSMLDNLSGLTSMLGLGGAGSQAAPAGIPGAEILGSLLGNKQSKVSEAIGKSSGLNASQVGPLLGMLAPMLMGSLGKKSGGGSAADLAGMLRGETQAMEKSGTGSMVGRLLDQDGDGDFDVSDIMKLGMNSLFGRKS